MTYYVIIGSEHPQLFRFNDADSAIKFAETAKAKAVNNLRVGVIIEYVEHDDSACADNEKK